MMMPAPGSSAPRSGRPRPVASRFVGAPAGRRTAAIAVPLAIALVLGNAYSGAALTPTSAGTATSAAVTAPAADVKQPTLREVTLSGIDRSVLAVAPEPDEASETATLTAQSLTPRESAKKLRVKPAVAAEVTTSTTAELVAVAADTDFPEGSTIQVRVREKAAGATKATWSAWTELDVDASHGPDPGSAEAKGARVGSAPLMTGGASAVQVRIDTPTGEVPAGTELTLVDAPTAKSDATLGTATGTLTASGATPSSGKVSAKATVGKPTIVTRAQWGADESWRGRAPYYTSDIRAGFIHHTASTSNYSASQAAAQIRAIYAYHTKSLGHSDIDYNFVVDRFGRLYEGRYGGMDKAVLGGHTAGFNEHTFAVVALGNFQSFNPAAKDMTAIKDSIARLFAWKLGLYGVNPGAKVKLVSAGYTKPTKYAKGKVAEIYATSSHQTVNYTSCPGTNLQNQLASIRALAASYSKVVISAPSPPGQEAVAGSATPVALSSAADRAVSWTADILSPCSDTPVRTFRGSTTKAGKIAISWDLKDSSGKAVLPAEYTVRMSGTAADGTTVVPVSSRVTVKPVAGGSWGPCGNASRVIGADVAATSVLWGKINASSATTVVVTGTGASGSTAMAAGLAAAPLAASLDAPLLQTSATSLASQVSTDIKARAPREVLVVGSTSVVSDAVVKKLAALGPKVTRISGSSAAATAAAVAARMGAKTPAVLVSPDGSPATALAGTALAAARGVPVLMASDDTIPAVTVAALAGRSSVTVASSAMTSSTVDRAVSGTWKRLSASDAVAASLAVAAAFPGTPKSVMVLPENDDAWQIGPAAAAAGVPLLFTASPALSQGVGDFIEAHSALRATTTPVSRTYLDDDVLGATSRVLLGQPWAPGGVTVTPAPTATSTRALTRTNASPEPISKGGTLKASATVTAKYSDGVWRKVPAGVAFVLQFKATGATKYTVVASGTTTSGKASIKVKASKSGRWRIVIGSKVSASDYVRVTK